MKFINRNTELKSLNDKWAEKKSHFVIIYGKRLNMSNGKKTGEKIITCCAVKMVLQKIC